MTSELNRSNIILVRLIPTGKKRERMVVSVPKITLKAARVNAGLTQREAAKRLGIAYQTLSRYEDESGSVRQDMLKKMSELYDMPIEFIFFK